MGGGIAGCCAAISPARQGLKVILFEKGATKKSGSGGSGCDHWLNSPHPGSPVTAEEVVEWELEMSNGYPNALSRYIAARESFETLLELERVGGVKTITTDMRVIAATHQDLQEAVEQKRFREDLYYRLNVIPITLPPLRERKSDIPLLAHHFLHHFNRTKKKAVREIAPDAMERLLRYHWPGNVRELENTIERIVILSSSDVITVKDLPERFQTPSEADRSVAVEIPEGGISLDEAVNEFERRLILHALHKSDWVKSKAAQLLNVNRTTLIEKIKRQKLEPASDEQASS
jgi:DNA-binding NtrC family response regulator